ncbi:hypothetical protein M405DRAFT_555884 [Rhizopogon salebrosus TDB-379]|nr:hypothetical protein M405DRAFT_555884 [Rhizopogon salebrosus TDB-379]
MTNVSFSGSTAHPGFTIPLQQDSIATRTGLILRRNLSRRDALEITAIWFLSMTRSSSSATVPAITRCSIDDIFPSDQILCIHRCRWSQTGGAYLGNLSSMRYAKLLKHISTEMKTIVERQRISGPLRVYNLGIFIWVDAMAVPHYHGRILVKFKLCSLTPLERGVGMIGTYRGNENHRSPQGISVHQEFTISGYLAQ